MFTVSAPFLSFMNALALLKVTFAVMGVCGTSCATVKVYTCASPVLLFMLGHAGSPHLTVITVPTATGTLAVRLYSVSPT